jgi:hypothetical protein
LFPELLPRLVFHTPGHCDDCRHSFKVVEIAPALHNQVWYEFAEASDILCVSCMFVRAAQRQVRLSLASLVPCPFNLLCNPSSFDQVLQHVHNNKLPPHLDLQAWHRAAVDCLSINSRPSPSPEFFIDRCGRHV